LDDFIDSSVRLLAKALIEKQRGCETITSLEVCFTSKPKCMSNDILFHVQWGLRSDAVLVFNVTYVLVTHIDSIAAGVNALIPVAFFPVYV
jgi:hypothetical protein